MQIGKFSVVYERKFILHVRPIFTGFLQFIYHIKGQGRENSSQAVAYFNLDLYEFSWIKTERASLCICENWYRLRYNLNKAKTLAYLQAFKAVDFVQYANLKCLWLKLHALEKFEYSINVHVRTSIA